MENKIVGKDMICPVTNQHCDDECCMPGSKCNLSGNSITPGFRMYYFTESKWYGPLPFIKLPIEEILNFPSGDSLIPEFAGMVKEEGKDFAFEIHWNRNKGRSMPTHADLDKIAVPLEEKQTAVPVAEEIKTQPKKLIMDKEVKMVVSFPDHFRMVLKAANGDTFTTKSEELMDFISSCKPVAEEGKQTFSEEERNNFAIGFAEWHNNLSPTQRCTVHPPAGSGSGYGLYNLSTEDLLKKYLKTKQ